MLLLLLLLLLLLMLDVGFMVVVVAVVEGALDVLALAGVALVDEGEDMARWLFVESGEMHCDEDAFLDC